MSNLINKKLKKQKTSPCKLFFTHFDVSPSKLNIFRDAIKDTYKDILKQKALKFSVDFENNDLLSGNDGNTLVFSPVKSDFQFFPKKLGFENHLDSLEEDELDLNISEFDTKNPPKVKRREDLTRSLGL